MRRCVGFAETEEREKTHIPSKEAAARRRVIGFLRYPAGQVLKELADIVS